MFEKLRASTAPRKMLALTTALITALGPSVAPAYAANTHPSTATPIKHLVVIFQENVSFDHYFGTYPNAQNLSGEPPFFAQPGTPTVNGLSTALLTINGNSLNTGNAAGAANPFRLSHAQASTADQDHDYTPEQQAF